MVVKYMYSYNFYRSFHIFFVLLLLLIMSGDIEVNPGPDNNKNLVFSLSNMQSLYANKSDLKLSELQIMANDWHIDVLAVTETWLYSNIPDALVPITGGGPRVVVNTAAFHARVRFSVPGLGGWKKQKKCFFPIHVWKSVLWGASVTEM